MKAYLEGTSPKLFRGTNKSLWRFWEHGVTSSFLGLYLQCKEQTRLHYCEGWSSRMTPIYFEFGTCCHWVLEMAYKRPMDANAYAKKGAWRPDIKWIKLKLKEYKAMWLASVPRPTERQLETMEEVYGLALVVLPSYFERWSGDFTGKYNYEDGRRVASPHRWHSLENVFCIPYTYPDGKKTFIRGRRDGVFWDAKKQLWVFDTKCRSRDNDQTALDTLASDLQQNLYLWVTWKETGKVPAGTIMNIIKRPTNYRRVDETLAAYLDRVRVLYEKKESYDISLKRYEFCILKSDLLQWQSKILDPIMMDVRLWWEGKTPHYQNPHGLETKYGKCEMFAPLTRGDFTLCYRRPYAFNELGEAGDAAKSKKGK